MTRILYHNPCCDGFAAAFVAWLKLGVSATYHPVRYHEPLPAEVRDGDEVIILDFSYSRETLEALAKRCKVLVLDHHPSARQELDGLPFARFEQDKCGCVMAWEHYFPGRPLPRALQYIDWRDRGVMFQAPETVPADLPVFYAGLWLGTARNFHAWKHALSCFDEQGTATLLKDMPDVENLEDQTSFYEEQAVVFQRGGAIATAQALAVQDRADEASWLSLDGHKVPAACSAADKSEIAAELLRRHPEAPFAVVWSVRSSTLVEVSLRSRKDGFDVGALAKQHGGGGHRCAAGFSNSLPLLASALEGEIQTPAPQP